MLANCSTWREMPSDDEGTIDPAQLTLRPFSASDDAEVTSWFPDAGALRFFAGRRLTWPLDSEQWASIRADPATRAWTAVLGDDPTPVGHAEMVDEPGGLVQFTLLAIAPSLRGQHLGKEVVGQMVEKAREGGYRLVYLFVHPDNATAIRGYRSHGFEPAEELDSAHGLRLELRLGGA